MFKIMRTPKEEIIVVLVIQQRMFVSEARGIDGQCLYRSETGN
jgi:hypothetical protein